MTKQIKESVDVRKLPEIQALLAMHMLLTKGFFTDSVQHSPLLNCYKFDNTKPHAVQECRGDVDKMCYPCRIKYFMQCADWAFNQHTTTRMKELRDA